VSDLPPEIPTVTIRNFCASLCHLRGAALAQRGQLTRDGGLEKLEPLSVYRQLRLVTQ
jgi:hypothetical protein